MTGDFKKTITIEGKGKNRGKVWDLDIYECACESCLYRDQPWICNRVRVLRTKRGTRKGPSQSNNEPCVITCDGYEFKEWTDESWKKAQAEMWEKRKKNTSFEMPVNEEYEDYLDEQKFLLGFDYKD